MRSRSSRAVRRRPRNERARLQRAESFMQIERTLRRAPVKRNQAHSTATAATSNAAELRRRIYMQSNEWTQQVVVVVAVLASGRSIASSRRADRSRDSRTRTRFDCARPHLLCWRVRARARDAKTRKVASKVKLCFAYYSPKIDLKLAPSAH